MKTIYALLTSIIIFFLAGCSKSEHAGHDDHGGHGHAHTAAHGGSLVMLGDHAYQLEFVLDKDAEEMTLYVFDGHAENYVRIKSGPFRMIVRDHDGAEATWTFNPVADKASGETVGDTSTFKADTSGWEDYDHFDCEIEKITIRGQRFSKVDFGFPEGRH